MALTWDELELPVLRWVLRAGDDGTGDLALGSAEPFAGAPEVTQAQAEEAVTRLAQHGLVVGERVETSGYTEWLRVRPSAGGLRVLGEWPPADSALVQEALVAVLLSVAGELPDEESGEAAALRRAAGGIAGFAKGVFADVALGELQSLGGGLVEGDGEDQSEKP